MFVCVFVCMCVWREGGWLGGCVCVYVCGESAIERSVSVYGSGRGWGAFCPSFSYFRYLNGTKVIICCSACLPMIECLGDWLLN